MATKPVDSTKPVPSTPKVVFKPSSVASTYQTILSEADKHEVADIIATVLDAVQAQLKQRRTIFVAGDVCKWFEAFNGDPTLLDRDPDLHRMCKKHQIVFTKPIVIGRVLAEHHEKITIQRVSMNGNRIVWAM